MLGNMHVLNQMVVCDEMAEVVCKLLVLRRLEGLEEKCA